MSEMKFFTPAWRMRAQDGNDWSAFEQYAAYLNSVRDPLPPRLLALHDEHTRHDAKVQSVTIDADAKTVRLVLLGWDAGLKHPIRYTLAFSGVSTFEQALIAQGATELGDIAYWECEWLGAEVSAEVEVRILFSSDARFRLRFQGFDFEQARR